MPRKASGYSREVACAPIDFSRSAKLYPVLSIGSKQGSNETSAVACVAPPLPDRAPGPLVLLAILRGATAPSLAMLADLSCPHLLLDRCQTGLRMQGLMSRMPGLFFPGVPAPEPAIVSAESESIPDSNKVEPWGATKDLLESYSRAHVISCLGHRLRGADAEAASSRCFERGWKPYWTDAATTVAGDASAGVATSVKSRPGLQSMEGG
ncbi:unnamed protein product, partial [Prorocentrum cordatum]